MPAYIYRVSQWLEKRFNAKGGQVVTDLDPSLSVQVAFPVGVEDLYLQGWNRFGVDANQPAVAAQNSRVRIRNPVGSNVIIVLEQLAAFTGAADQPFVAWGATTTDLSTLVILTFSRMDPRGNPTPTAIVSTAAQAPSGQAFLARPTGITQAADYIQYPGQQIPILPGQVVDVQCQAVNTALNVTLMWRERALELSELT